MQLLLWKIMAINFGYKNQPFIRIQIVINVIVINRIHSKTDLHNLRTKTHREFWEPNSYLLTGSTIQQEFKNGY